MLHPVLMEHYLNAMFVADLSINIFTLKSDLQLVVLQFSIIFQFSYTKLNQNVSQNSNIYYDNFLSK